MNFNLNKIMLTIIVVLMILPYSIYILGVSLAKIATVLIGLFFIYLVYSKRIKIKECLKNKFIIFNLIFASIILVSIIANYKTVKFNDIYEVVKYILFSMITIIVINICKEKENYLFLLKIINIIMIIISIFGIIQYINPFHINELYIRLYSDVHYETLINDYPNPRIIGTKVNPSFYGILMIVGTYFNLMYYKYARNKMLVYLSIFLCIINLMMTLTRTVQIAFLISIILFVLISIWITKGWKKALLTSGIVALSILLILILLPSSFTWRLFQVLDLNNSTSWIARIDKWKNYIGIIQNNLMLGIGAVKNHVNILGYVDSEWIQVILQYGVIGLISYIAMIISPLFCFFENKQNKNILKYFIPILSIIIINNISASTLISFESAIGFYMIIGLILIEPKNTKKVENSNDEILYINYVDMNNTSSGSSVRPKRIYDTFIEENFNVKLLTGSIRKEDKIDRILKVKEISKWLDNNVPKFCYIESPPTDPILYKEDRKLIKQIHSMGVKIGYFYRDAYYELGKEFVFDNKKVSIFSKKYLKYIYYKLLFYRDHILLYNNVDIVYFPSLSMSKYFKFKDMRALPPAGDYVEDIQNLNAEGIIYVGGISKRYGIELLMEALNKINKKQHVILRLVCRANEVCNIKKEYQEKDWLKIYNTSDKNDLKELYNNSKIALIPIEKSKYNNFAIPIKLYEYMQYNVPIVATNNFEVKNIIEKYNIGIVTDPDVEKFADAILKLYNDEELYLKLKNNEKKALLSENLWKHRIQKINEDLMNLEE